MNEQRWLIDKSALVRLTDSPEADVWSNRIERGLVHLAAVTRLEVGFSAQNGEIARRQFRESPLSAMPVEHLTPTIEDRALDVQALLADRGQHRGPSIPDLLIAATAELAELTVLHVDKTRSCPHVSLSVERGCPAAGQIVGDHRKPQQHPRPHPLRRTHDRLHRRAPADRHARIRHRPQCNRGLSPPTTTPRTASCLTADTTTRHPRLTTDAQTSRGSCRAR